MATNWYTVNAFRALAEHARASFAVGDRVIAYGRVRVNNWEAKGKNGTSVELEVEALGHDLRWGTTRFTKLVESKAVDAGAGSGAPDQSQAADGSHQANGHDAHADGSAGDNSAWASAGTGEGASDEGEFGRMAA